MFVTELLLWYPSINRSSEIEVKKTNGNQESCLILAFFVYCVVHKLNYLQKNKRQYTWPRAVTAGHL